ncbi:MAG: DNA helicase, partial [Caldisericia bacterium]|nr:DNA helicase [Caldisericia bacterium]
KKITKWDIFYYIYAMLHHPGYREEYKENLKRSLPRIPFASDFWRFASIGRELADIHINYESIEPYPLETIIKNKEFAKCDFRVTKMKLSKDKKELIYNDEYTFKNIPSEVYEYKLGNRSALEWIVDQYQVKVDKRSGIIQDPNNFDGDERYIFDLVGKIVAVSLETVKLVDELSKLSFK